MQLIVLLRRPISVSRIKSSKSATQRNDTILSALPTKAGCTGKANAGLKRKNSSAPSQSRDVPDEPVARIQSINDTLVAASIDNVNLFRLVSFVKDRDLCRKVSKNSLCYLRSISDTASVSSLQTKLHTCTVEGIHRSAFATASQNRENGGNRSGGSASHWDHKQ